MSRYSALSVVLAVLVLLTVAAVPAAAVDARMVRMPDVSATQITFAYAGDIWVVGRDGGTARRLSTPPGPEVFPRFSPDGTQIAFTGNYDGNADIYVVPTDGGLPTRVTHHPSMDRMLDWFPSGGEILYATGMTSQKDRFSHLYRVSAEGGLPVKLPVAYGEFAAVADDGKTLAFMPLARDGRTWKRYRGGMASEIYLFDLESFESKNVTTDDANDSQPMWHGDTLYFLSDRGEHKRWNIWKVRKDGSDPRQVTHFKEYDVHWPAIGPDAIVLEAAGRLYRVDLQGEELHEISIDVVTDLATLKPRVKDVGKLVLNAEISPSGKRAVVEARGEIFTLPVEHGVIRQLTHSSGSAERYPSWSPDGKSIAYWSDASGEYELTVKNADGTGEAKKVTSLGPGFRYNIFWSPDSEKVAFIDQAKKIWIVTVADGETTQVDQDPFLTEGGLRNFSVSWSSDSRWLTYGRGIPKTRFSAVFLYDTQKGASHQVTSGFYAAGAPAFDPGGEYLYFTYNRNFERVTSDFDNSWAYANSTHLAAVALRKDVKSPLLQRNDDEKQDDEEDEDDGDKKDDADKKKGKKDDDDDKDDEAKDEAKPVSIDLDGLESRIVVLPPAPGNYRSLAGADGKLVYLSLPRSGSPRDALMAGGTLTFWDLKEREEKKVVDGVQNYLLSADGKSVLVAQRGSMSIVQLAPEQKTDKKLALDDLRTVVDPAAEWRQIFNDVWRFERDFFYDAGLHGVDWPAMKQRYGKLLDDVVTRWDLNFVIGELIGELNASHAYRGGGDAEEPLRRGVGVLGADFGLSDGAYKISNIVDVAPWETEVRSPLREPGVDVGEGDYLLAVNGVPVDTSKSPWAAFEGLADTAVELTVSDKPSFAGARRVVVHTLSGEGRLRNLAWIEENRRKVEEATGGRVGYVYVPDTGQNGEVELVRQFLPQIDKPGLIVDERWNSGGQIPDRFIELLNRPRTNYWGVRDGEDWAWPPVAHEGPKAMLINGWSGSGGDLFPFFFRAAGLGPLIGMRTWGGLIGVSGCPALVDGGGVTVPTFGIYDLDGNWIVEGHGVEPDEGFEVPEDPTALAKGGDPQLERAIVYVLEQLEKNPPSEAKRPPSADRSGF